MPPVKPRRQTNLANVMESIREEETHLWTSATTILYVGHFRKLISELQQQ